MGDPMGPKSCGLGPWIHGPYQILKETYQIFKETYQFLTERIKS